MKGELEWCVLALAMPAEVQLALFPDFACKADELALELDRCLYELQDPGVTEEQKAAAQALDGLVGAMSGPSSAHLWTDEALRSHPAWEGVRAAARGVAEAFGWPLRRPPPSAGIYVPAGSPRRDAGLEVTEAGIHAATAR